MSDEWIPLREAVPLPGAIVEWTSCRSGRTYLLQAQDTGGIIVLVNVWSGMPYAADWGFWR